jgi:hypothetical protein
MTKQEAQALADRLTRVWGTAFKHTVETWHERLDMFTDEKGLRLSMGSNKVLTSFVEQDENPFWYEPAFIQEHYQEYRQKFYLSGVRVESTQHERLEWVREAIASKRLTQEEGEVLLNAQEAICSTI